MTRSYTWHDSLYMWHDLSIYMTWLIDICYITYSYTYDKVFISRHAWRRFECKWLQLPEFLAAFGSQSLISSPSGTSEYIPNSSVSGLTWTIHTYVWHDAFIGDMTHSYVWHDSSTGDAGNKQLMACAWRDSFICDFTYLCVWHDSFIRDMTHSYVIWLNYTCDTALHVWHDSFICVMWLIHMSDMTDSHV